MILEVGCGKNPSPEATINIDNKKYPATQILADCRALPFRESMFEGIIAFHVLEHLDDPESFFIEASRVLKQRGWVHVKVPVGLNAKTDPTHKHEWTFETPLFFTKSDFYHGFNLPFTVTRRKYNVELIQPNIPLLKTLLQGFFGLLVKKYQGLWISSMPINGELDVIFTKQD